MKTIDYTMTNGLIFRTREGTSDYNTANACGNEDEYSLLKYDVEGRIVFDFGAHIGGFSVLAASRGAHVVAVEPVPENAALARINADLNMLDIVVVEAAAGAPGGTKLAYGWFGDENADVHAFIGNTGLGQEGYNAHHLLDVPTVTLQELVDEHGLPYIVKMDCEGGEWPILAEPIASEVEIFTGEFHPWVGSSVTVGPYFSDNRQEIRNRIGATHDVTFSGPGGDDAGNFLAVKRP